MNATQTQTHSQAVAIIIVEQLGRPFALMTGARDFVTIDQGVQFDLPRTRHFVRDGINRVRIILTADDLYTMEFWKIGRRGLDARMVSRSEGIYFDMMRAEFTRQTGLYTSLR